MTVKDFIGLHCRNCDDFDPDYGGCQCYDGEECDYAWSQPRWRGLTMRQRVDEHCRILKSGKETEKSSKKPAKKKKVQKAERLEDVLMQIWNDGAEGIVYSESDLKSFVKRVKNAR